MSSYILPQSQSFFPTSLGRKMSVRNGLYKQHLKDLPKSDCFHLIQVWQEPSS